MTEKENTTQEPRGGSAIPIEEQLKDTQSALGERDTSLRELQERINSQEQEISILTTRLEESSLHLTQAQGKLNAQLQAAGEAVGKYRALLLVANPTIPEDLIQGEDIQALDASLEKARGIVEKVKTLVKAQTESTAVPAGAPPRTGTDVESLSSTEKIKYALRR
jgi:chromosome segregation ATPase